MSYPKFWTEAELDKLKSFYDSGLSMREVGEKYGKSVRAIVSAMKRHQLPRRRSSTTRTHQFYNSPLSFNVKSVLTKQEELLKTAGLMLYWGEGSKSPNRQVNFTNTDTDSISVFLLFLRKIYSPVESRLRCRLYCFSDQNIEDEINYWSKLTNIPKNQFTKPFIAKPKKQKHVKITHGVCHIVYSDTRLLAQILQDIKTLAQQLMS